MPRRSDTTVANNGTTPRPGVYITVKTASGALAALTKDDGSARANPFQSALDGTFYYNAADGTYTEEFRLAPDEAPTKIDTIVLVTPGSGVTVTPEQFSSLVVGSNWRAAIQAAINFATAIGGTVLLKSGATYEVWNTTKTTSRYGFSDDGHPLVIKGSVTIIGDGIGATIARKGVNGVAGSQQTLPIGGEGLWRGGGLYWSHAANVTQNTVVVLKNFKLDGGLNQGVPGGNVTPMTTVNGWDDTDKGLWIQDIKCGTVIMEDVEVTRFRGELNYFAAISDATDVSQMIMTRCWIHETDGDANNAQGGYFEAHHCRFGKAFAPEESLGRSGHKYFDCEFYDHSGTSNGVGFIGGPDPTFVGGQPYDYPVRQTAYVPWTELNNCTFRNCGAVGIGNWVRGKITCIDSYINCASRDLDIEAEMWLDNLNGFSACIIDSQNTDPTDIAGYNGPPSHIRVKVNLYRTKQAADAGRRWSQIFAFKGALVRDTCSFTSDYAEGVDYVWGPYGLGANMYSIPAVRCADFKESGVGQKGGGIYTNPSGDVQYCPTWPAVLLYPSVSQYVITLTDTSGHQFFFDDGARVRFINGDNAGRVTIFPVGGAFLALRKPRAFSGQFDFLDLAYDKMLNKWVEVGFNGPENVPIVLTDAATVAINMGYGRDFVLTLAGNRTLANPTNATPGQRGLIRVTQDGTGTRTLAYGTNWRFAGGAAVGGVLTTTAAAVDVIDYEVGDDGKIYARLAKAFAA